MLTDLWEGNCIPGRLWLDAYRSFQFLRATVFYNFSVWFPPTLTSPNNYKSQQAEVSFASLSCGHIFIFPWPTILIFSMITWKPCLFHFMYASMCLTWVYVSVGKGTVLVQVTLVTERRHWIPWTWSYRQCVKYLIWVLATKLESSERVTNAIKHEQSLSRPCQNFKVI